MNFSNLNIFNARKFKLQDHEGARNSASASVFKYSHLGEKGTQMRNFRRSDSCLLSRRQCSQVSTKTMLSTESTKVCSGPAGHGVVAITPRKGIRKPAG